MGVHQSNQVEGSGNRDAVTSVDRDSTKHSSAQLHEATVTFERDCVRVVATQPVDLSFEEKQANASAFSLCWKHLSLNPSKHFELSMLGSPQSLKYEVRIDHSLVENLPLLHDVATNADASGNAAPMKLTSSIWGLVSLLVLLEGGITPQQWFEGAAGYDPVASLPGQTLEVASYLDCSSVKKDVVAWLQQVCLQVIGAYALCASKDVKDSAFNLSCTKNWNRTEVLRWATMLAPDPVKNEIMAISTKSTTPSLAAKRLVHLPQDLLCRWLESLAPKVDLRDSDLSSVSLARLLACLQMMQGQNVEELHIPLAMECCSLPCSAQEAWSNLQVADHQLCTLRVGHSNGLSGLPTHVSLGVQCSYCGDLCGALQYAPVVPITEALEDQQAHFKLHAYASANQEKQSRRIVCARCGLRNETSAVTHYTVGRICDIEGCGGFMPAYNTSQHSILPNMKTLELQLQSTCIQSLATIGGFGAHMLSLQHLGLHNILPSIQVAHNLGQLLGSLPHNVTTLSLDFLLQDSSPSLNVLLFKAIGRMRSLRQLHMPQWEEVVGGDAAACVEPLMALPHLQEVLVAEVKSGDVFPAGLQFKSIDESS